MAKKKYASKNVVMTGNNTDLHLIADIRALIESARIRIAGAVNAELTVLYWRVGKRIREDILKERRASYGEEIIVTVSQKLVPLYGKGFDVKNLWRMIQFAERFSAEGIIVTLSRQLSWFYFCRKAEKNYG